MPKHKIYSFNKDTLQYEIQLVSNKVRFFKFMLVFLGSVALSVLYFWIYVYVLGLESPKTMLLRSRNQDWLTRMELLERRIDRNQMVLSGLEARDNEVYRSVFGMNVMPDDVIGGNYRGFLSQEDFSQVSQSSTLYRIAGRLDRMMTESYKDSKSLDEVLNMSKRVGDMASCIPAIAPFNPIPGTYRLSSSFGYRSDPISGRRAHHEGQDFAMNQGIPLYAVGDGVVEKVNVRFTGYGNEVVIDHGFGYKTRYAHLRTIDVAEGVTVKRGDKIGESGNSGKSTGPHLHYEVIYRGNRVNPMNFLDLNVDPEEYMAMVRKNSLDSPSELQKSFSLKQRNNE